MDKLIIEVAQNELLPKALNPNVPYGPEEIATDAEACVAAGASLLHFHARDPDTGETEWTNTDRYRETMRLIRERGVSRDVLFYPTYKFLNEVSLAHVAALAADDDVRLAMAAVDVGAVNLNRFNRDTGTFTNPDYSKAYSYERMTFFYELCKANGLRPLNGCAEPGHIRHVLAFKELQLVDEPVLFKFFTSEYAPFGMPPTPHGLQLYPEIIAELAPDLRYVWFVQCYGPAILPMAAQAVVAGGHVRIGIGDEPFTNDGLPTNADLIERVVAMAKSVGREIATPREARDIMGLPQYEAGPPSPQKPERRAADPAEEERLATIAASLSSLSDAAVALSRRIDDTCAEVEALPARISQP